MRTSEKPPFFLGAIGSSRSFPVAIQARLHWESCHFEAHDLWVSHSRDVPFRELGHDSDGYRLFYCKERNELIFLGYQEHQGTDAGHSSSTRDCDNPLLLTARLSEALVNKFAFRGSEQGSAARITAPQVESGTGEFSKCKFLVRTEATIWRV